MKIVINMNTKEKAAINLLKEEVLKFKEVAGGSNVLKELRDHEYMAIEKSTEGFSVNTSEDFSVGIITAATSLVDKMVKVVNFVRDLKLFEIDALMPKTLKTFFGATTSNEAGELEGSIEIDFSNPEPMVVEGKPSQRNIRDIINGITSDLHRLDDKKYLMLTPAWYAREAVLTQLNDMLEGSF